MQTLSHVVKYVNASWQDTLGIVIMMRVFGQFVSVGVCVHASDFAWALCFICFHYSSQHIRHSQRAGHWPPRGVQGVSTRTAMTIMWHWLIFKYFENIIQELASIVNWILYLEPVIQTASSQFLIGFMPYNCAHYIVQTHIKLKIVLYYG